MTTNHHTAITTGAAANAATVNSPLGSLDAAIGALSDGQVAYWDAANGKFIGLAGFIFDGTTFTVGETSPTAGGVASFGGAIEVTDGSGGALATVDNTFRRYCGVTTTLSATPVYLYDGHINATIATTNSYTIATHSPANANFPFIAKIFGTARNTTSQASEMFEVKIGKVIGQTTIVSFTSIGATKGSAFLASGNFTATDDGSEISIIYTNATAASITLICEYTLIAR